MAIGATIYTFSVQLSDVDRGIYETLELRVARHPSETAAFMLTRLLAYCLEFRDGIQFTAGIAAVDEPAVLARDLTGQLTAWIEVGAPDAQRLHRSSKQAPRCAVYSPRDPAPWLAQMAGQTIHRREQLPVFSFGREFMDAASAALSRRANLVLSVTERQLFLDIDGQGFSTEIQEHSLA